MRVQLEGRDWLLIVLGALLLLVLLFGGGYLLTQNMRTQPAVQAQPPVINIVMPGQTPEASSGQGGEGTAQADPAQNPIVVLAPAGKGVENLPGVTGTELKSLIASYKGGVKVVHTWKDFKSSLGVNADSRQPDHGHLWSGVCEGSVFHRGGVNKNLQGRDAGFWLQDCATGKASESWAVWVPWAP